MKLIVLLIPFIILLGCTSPVSLDEATPVPKNRLFLYQDAVTQSQLFITRDKGFYGAACNINLYIDGKLAAKFATSEKAYFYIESGEHILGVSSACGSTIDETPIILKPSEQYRARIYTPTGGNIKISKTAFN